MTIPCFFCSKTEPIESFDESLDLLKDTEGLCKDHKEKCLARIAELEAGAPKKFILKTGPTAVYKPSPVVKQGFMDRTAERPENDGSLIE